jgi:hypothetical protein
MSDPAQHPEANPVDDVDFSDDFDVEAEAAGIHLGDVVKVSHRDPYSGRGDEVERFGQVVDVDVDGAVRVAYFVEVSDPIPLDPTVHGRDDAPRVEIVS